jgi:hypothetical protein
MSLSGVDRSNWPSTPHFVSAQNRRKEPLGRSRRRWEDNIKMVFREIGWGCMDWIDLAQDRDQWRALVNMVMYLRVP